MPGSTLVQKYLNNIWLPNSRWAVNQHSFQGGLGVYCLQGGVFLILPCTNSVKEKVLKCKRINFEGLVKGIKVSEQMQKESVSG